MSRASPMGVIGSAARSISRGCARLASSAAQATEQAQGGLHLRIPKGSQRDLEAGQVIQVVLQVWRLQADGEGRYRLHARRGIGEGQLDLASGLVRHKPPFDRLLLRDGHLQIAFDNRLAGQGAAGGKTFGRGPEGRSSPYVGTGDINSTSAAASLSAARLGEGKAGPLDGFANEGAGGDFDPW